jgi:ubiquinol-cytochrome c reductase cytochrome c1 subunit
MKKLITILLMLPFMAMAAGGGIELDDADIDLADNTSLQRGAQSYVTYCLGCHSVKHIRYIRMANDFDLEEDKLLDEIAPEGAGIYDKMHSAMNAHDAEKWFGINPPDLSLIARSRGPDWLYTYLRSFYVDNSKTLGINNAVLKDVGMPNPFWQLQGLQQPVFRNVSGIETLTQLKMSEPGTMAPEEFDQLVNDLVNFLVYVGEPHQLERQRLGKYVLFYILLFIVVAYLLKKEYWKDVDKKGSTLKNIR